MNRVLILGASGRFGRAAAEAFWNAGWQVKTFDRATDDLTAAAQGVDVIVHAANPAYPDWAQDVPQLTADVIEAAKASGATVLIPGNVYVYGAGSPALLTVATPHRATNPLGRIRREMEDAFRASGVRTIVLRAGDFIDTEASGNWFDGVIAKKAAKGVLVAPGDADAIHAWAYLPDLARAAVGLAGKRAHLAPFEEVLFPGFALTFHELAAHVRAVTGRQMEVRSFPWWALRLARPFWRMAPGLLEMRYLWSMPHRLDGTRFHALLPGFRATDPATAIASALNIDVHPDEPVAGGAFDIAAE